MQPGDRAEHPSSSSRRDRRTSKARESEHLGADRVFEERASSRSASRPTRRATARLLQEQRPRHAEAARLSQGQEAMILVRHERLVERFRDSDERRPSARAHRRDRERSHRLAERRRANRASTTPRRRVRDRRGCARRSWRRPRAPRGIALSPRPRSASSRSSSRVDRLGGDAASTSAPSPSIAARSAAPARTENHSPSWPESGPR